MAQGNLFGPTLTEARNRVWREAETTNGTFCPCCDRFMKVYRRKFNSSMARGLIWLTSQPEREFIHVPTVAPRPFIKSRESIASIWMWGFAEAHVNESAVTRTPGLWRATDAGRLFAANRSTVLSHVLVYNTEVIDRVGEQIDIVGALGKHFNYQELMRDYPRPDEMGDKDR